MGSWILTDFYSNPLDPHRMKENVQGGDWLHPNPEGYLQMGEYAVEIISGENPEKK